jgi:hypothetical protein
MKVKNACFISHKYYITEPNNGGVNNECECDFYFGNFF